MTLGLRGLMLGVLGGLAIAGVFPPGVLRPQAPAASADRTLGPAPARDQKRVLGLYSARPDQPRYIAFASTFATAVTHAWGNVDFYAEYLDYGRLPITDEYLDSFAEFLRSKYSGDRRPDVVFAINDAAFRFIDRHGAHLFLNTPVIFVGPEDRWLPHSPSVFWEYDWASSIELALTLHPGTRHVFVVAGSSEYDRHHLDAVRNQVSRLEPRVRVTYLEGLPLDRLERTLSVLPPDSIIYFVLLTQDGAGRRYEQLAGLDRVAAVASAPIYAWSETMMGHGIVGGVQATYEGMARATADAVVRLFHGGTPSQVPLAKADVYATQVDWRQVQRWRIDASRLPAGTRILFREPSLWTEYRDYIALGLALVVIQSLLIGALLVQRAGRRRVTATLRESEQRYRATAERNQDLAGRLIHAQEQERTRIARDLHDDVGQRVASLSIGLSGLRRQIPEPPAAAVEALSRLQQEAMMLSRDVRRIAHDLHPGVLEHVGLIKALESRCAEVGAKAGLSTRVIVDEDWSDVPDSIALCLYRIAQEALRNTIEHAGAHGLSIRLTRHDACVVMRIADDGRGFDAQTAPKHEALGLVSMRERVRMLGGRFDLDSSAECGTVVTVTLPAPRDLP